MKFLKFIIILLIPVFGYGQMYERGRKNFFLEPEGGVNFSNYKSNAFTGNNMGTYFGMSVGKTWAGVFKTGLVYRYGIHDSGKRDPIGMPYDSRVTRQTAGIKAEILLPLFSGGLGKSNKYECRAINNYFILGPEFGYNFTKGSENFKMNSTEFLLNAGWGFLFKKSGGRKKQQANDIFICLNLKKGLSPYAVSDNMKLYSTYWGVSILWIRYKTGNFLGN